ncbi:MAG: hypothetical protein Q4B21_06905 [Bacteroidia bacterium]|nr:hypothetical protein [Bacteroidia bacterium]
MPYRKFDTCFFERYAQLTLETILGREYAGMENKDRPDLQAPDRSLGIEVTRAMEPNKYNSNQLLKELAGMQIKEEQKADMEYIVQSGYGYGLPGLNYTGLLEEEYWKLAQPLQRIITSKVEKVASGFYGDFKEFGLFVFCRDLLDLSQVETVTNYIILLQDNLDIRYNTLFLSQTDTLYVCRLTDNIMYEGIESRITVHFVPDNLRRDFFCKSLGYK